jgi:pimeloyl-ACP methyl ester carboxylesterase
MPSPFVIDDFGGRIATVWSELRPATRGLVERALQAAASGTPGTRNSQYDARADLELSRFLAALDDRAAEKTNSLDAEIVRKLKSIADTCASVLQEQTESAEVFAQLVRRAQMQKDYKRIDLLADALTSRFPPSEICELARSEDVIVRELANEALARCPVTVLTGLLDDPVDEETARAALRRQVAEYGSEEARRIVNALEQEEF